MTPYEVIVNRFKNELPRFVDMSEQVINEHNDAVLAGKCYCIGILNEEGYCTSAYMTFAEACTEAREIVGTINCELVEVIDIELNKTVQLYL